VPGVVFANDVSTSNSPSDSLDIPYLTHLSGWQILWQRLNPFAKSFKVPSMGETMMQIVVLSNRQTSDETRDLADFYMRLPVKGHSMLEFDALNEIVAKGYEAARQQISLWENDEQFQALREIEQSIS